MEELVFSGFVGIDWGEKTHQVCVLDGAGRVRGNRAFSHTGKGLRALVKWLKKLTGVSPASVAVVIERPDGPVVATLLAAGFAVYAINPRQSSNLRKVFDHAGNKGDRKDSWLLAEAGRIHRDAMRRVQPHPALIERLRERTKTTDRLLRDQLRQCQRIRRRWWTTSPLLEVASKLKHLRQPLFLAVFGKAPTPEAAKKVRLSTWAKLLQRNGVTRITAERMFALFREEALTVVPGATAAAVESIRTALALLQVLNAEIGRAEEQMTQLLDALSEMEEVGGGSDATEPDRPSCARGRGWETSRWRGCSPGGSRRCAVGRRLRVASGVAPVNVQSGKFDTARQRRAVGSSLQQAAYLLARGVLRWDEEVKAYNRKLKEAGKTTARRQRSIADKEFRRLCAMVRHRTLYDPNYSGRRGRAAA